VGLFLVQAVLLGLSVPWLLFLSYNCPWPSQGLESRGSRSQCLHPAFSGSFLVHPSRRTLHFSDDRKPSCTFIKSQHEARHQWLTSVILATQEAKIRRIKV
jgi:hypothetical protein